MSDKAKSSSPKATSPKQKKVKSSKLLDTSLREARYLSPRNIRKRTRCNIRFFLDKDYTLSCAGAPNQKLLSILYHFVDSDSRAFPLASTDPVTSEELAYLRISGSPREKASDSSSSASSTSPSLLTKVKRGKTVSDRSEQATQPSRGSLARSVSKSPTKTKVSKVSIDSDSTTDTEKLSDSTHSPQPQPRALSFSSDSQSDCTAGPSGKGKAKKAKTSSGRSSDSQSRSPLPCTSAAVAEPDSDRPQSVNDALTWDTSIIPAIFVSTRAKQLFQTHRRNQTRVHPNYRVTKRLSDFLGQAEDELARERLALEYYSAERAPQASAARGARPSFHYRAYKQHREIKRLSGLIHSLNEISLQQEKPILESSLDYYWDLNNRGFALFNEELQLDPETPYTPSVYREKILITDIRKVAEYSFNKQIEQETEKYLGEQKEEESQEFFESSQI